MKRISLWVLSTLSALVLLFSYSTSTSGPLATSATTSVQSPVVSTAQSSAGSRTAGSSSGSSNSPSATPSTGTTITASDTVTGSTVQTRWGPVQVELTIANGKITQVSVLQYPSGNGKDQEINGYALPILTQETVAAQSASIDMVSGATVTSGGYLSSLQSALDQANL